MSLFDKPPSPWPVLLLTFLVSLFFLQHLGPTSPQLHGPAPLQYLDLGLSTPNGHQGKGGNTVQVADCGCQRNVERVGGNSDNVEETGGDSDISLGNTTCGQSAFIRGFHQKVVSFTFFESGEGDGSNDRTDKLKGYFQGIEQNLELVKQFYPGFVTRLYFDTVTEQVKASLCQLACRHPHLDLCPASNIPKLGNATLLYPLIWRFLPVLDPQVDIFMSRDLDSRITDREEAAVKQFLQSDAKVHVMRDHPAHTAVMMGGMWAAKVNLTRNQFRSSFSRMFKDGVSYMDRFKGGWDQVALQRFVWRWAKKVSMGHDSYTCKSFSYTRPFPTRREKGVGNYVGSVVTLNATISSICPEKCRPKEHKDWEMC